MSERFMLLVSAATSASSSRHALTSSATIDVMDATVAVDADGEGGCGAGGRLVRSDIAEAGTAASRARAYLARLTSVSRIMAGFVGAWYVGDRMVLRSWSMLSRSCASDSESPAAKRVFFDVLDDDE